MHCSTMLLGHPDRLVVPSRSRLLPLDPQVRYPAATDLASLRLVRGRPSQLLLPPPLAWASPSVGWSLGEASPSSCGIALRFSAPIVFAAGRLRRRRS